MLQPHLVLAYESAVSTLSCAKSMPFFGSRATFICTQALHLVILLNNCKESVEPHPNEYGPTMDLNKETLTLQKYYSLAFPVSRMTKIPLEILFVFLKRYKIGQGTTSPEQKLSTRSWRKCMTCSFGGVHLL
jgi:hypothetical protein